MNYYSEIDVATRKQAFDTMVYSYVKTKGYELCIDTVTSFEYSSYEFKNGHLVYSTIMDFRGSEEIYVIFDRVIKRVEEALEPSKTDSMDALTYAYSHMKPIAEGCTCTATKSGLEIKGNLTTSGKLFLNREFHIPPLKGPAFRIPRIKDVIFNYPATIVFWTDGTKTVVKCQGDDVYDPEKGLAMAISKKALGNKRDYYHTFLKCLKKYKRPTPWINVKVSVEEAASNLKKLTKAASKFSRDLKCKSKDTLVQKAYACLVKDNDHDAAVGYLGEYLDD